MSRNFITIFLKEQKFKKKRKKKPKKRYAVPSRFIVEDMVFDIRYLEAVENDWVKSYIIN